jgi:hypothetical protein
VLLESVTISPEAVEGMLRFAPGESLRTSECDGLADRVMMALPGLRGHRCDNDTGATFAEEIRDTEIAHLVEHAALEVMAMAGSPDTLRGLTHWDVTRDGRGSFHVRLEYDDSLVAARALSFAVRFVEAATSRAGLPDALAEARDLRELRKSGG